MLDIRLIRENPDKLDNGLKRRGKDSLSKIILDLDQQHRQVLTDLQSLQAQRNQLAKQFGELKRIGQDTTALSQQSDSIKQNIGTLEKQSQELENKLQNILLEIPNIPAYDCPDGQSEEDNIVLREVGIIPSFSFSPQHHYELGEKLNVMDFERAAKLSGTRFVVLYDVLAKLERALANFMLDTHTNEFGYKEVYPPLLVNETAMYGTGQLPKFREDQFQTNYGHWLIPTAEVVLTNLVANEILSDTDLPLRFTAYTPCFRAEAGSAGRDTRGLIRQHQFTKVELVSITTPDQSKAEHERMTSAAETILKKLGLAYRVMSLCTADIGFSAEKTYDLEVWLPGQNTYREISSCSRCGDFQARRMNTRYRSEKGNSKTQFVHTLNGSGLAVGRTLVAIMENYQQEDGSILIPDILIPYMGGIKKIEPINKF